MTNRDERKVKDRRKEITAYSIISIFWLGGLAMCILGVFAYNSPVEMKYNSIYQASKAWGEAWHLSHPVDFRIVGTLVCLLAMVFFLIFVNHFANRYEKDVIRRSRQEKRLNELLEEDKKKSEAEIQNIKKQQELMKEQLLKQREAEAKAPVGPSGPALPQGENK